MGLPQKSEGGAGAEPPPAPGWLLVPRGGAGSKVGGG